MATLNAGGSVAGTFDVKSLDTWWEAYQKRSQIVRGILASLCLSLPGERGASLVPGGFENLSGHAENLYSMAIALVDHFDRAQEDMSSELAKEKELRATAAKNIVHLKEKNEQLEQQVLSLKGTIVVLKSIESDRASSAERAQDALSRSRNDVESLRAELSVSRTALKETTARAEAAEAKVTALEGQLATKSAEARKYEAELRASKEKAETTPPPSNAEDQSVVRTLVQRVNAIGRMVTRVYNTHAGVASGPSAPPPPRKRAKKRELKPQAQVDRTFVLTAPYGKEIYAKKFAEDLCKEPALVPADGDVTVHTCDEEGWYRAGPSIYVQQVKRVLFVHAPSADAYRALESYYQARSQPQQGSKVALKVRPWNVMPGEQYRQTVNKGKAPASA